MRLFSFSFFKIHIVLLTGLSCLQCNYRYKNSAEVVEVREINFPKVREIVPDDKLTQNLWIFILAGQSNMAGRGWVEPQDTVSNERIWSLGEDGKWYYAKEPLHLYEPKSTGLDCGLSFAEELLHSIPDNVVIGLLPCAVGGSSISQWINNEEHRKVKLLSNLSNKVEIAQKYGSIKGILWHQGENDSRPPKISKYSARIDSLFTEFRRIVGIENLPILVGELGSYKEPIERQMKWDSINLMIRQYCSIDPHAYLISTGDLSDRGDKVHFNSPSIRLLGRRYGEQFIKECMHGQQ